MSAKNATTNRDATPLDTGSDHGHPVLKALCALLGILLAAIIVYAAIMLASLSEVRSEGEQIQSGLQQMHVAIDNVSIEDVEICANSIALHTEALNADLSGWQWVVASYIPGIGEDVRAAQRVAEVADTLAREVLVPAVDVAGTYADGIASEGILAVFNESFANDVADAATKAASVIVWANEQLEAIGPTHIEILNDVVAQLRDTVGTAADLIERYGTLKGHLDDLKSLFAI